MPLLQQASGLLEAVRGEMTPKFLATRSAAGAPNVVPVVSILPAEDQPDILFFGNFLLRKSIANLKEDPRAGILVITQDLRGWALTGDLVEFQRTGPYVERQMGSSLLRYNAYTGIRDAGVIRVRSVERAFHIPRLQVARDYLLARLAALRVPVPGDAAVAMPLPAQREFARMVAVKVLAWIAEDGYPAVAPALSLQPAGAHALVGRRPSPSPPAGALAAANVLTFEAISYQAKGHWLAAGGAGVLAVEEVYAGGPPIPGGRVA